MPSPKEFITQAIEMETFFEDEEPTFEEFMKYPPFSTLMSDDFTVPKMIELYRDGNLIFVDYQTIVDYGKNLKRHMNVVHFSSRHHKCEKCKKKFAAYKDLEMHLHRKNIVLCNICDARYSNEKDLI